MRMQNSIYLLGWMLLLLGLVLLVLFFVNEAIRTNAIPSDVWYDITMIAELSLSLSVVFIFSGIILACVDIIPSDTENNPLVTHKITFAIGEITKEQYDQMNKELDDSSYTH